MQGRKIWIGRWFVGVAILHTVVGLVMGGPTLMGMLQRGLFNSAGEPMTELVTWFLMFGALMAMLGIAANELERNATFTSARSLGIGALLVAVTGAVLMPISGFWLAFPPAIALLRRRQ